MYGIKFEENGSGYREQYSPNRAADFVAEGQRDILCQFLGASNFGVTEEDLRLVFRHQSADGLSEETRTYILLRENDPDVNLEIIRRALAEQRWYKTKRTGEQFVWFDPKAAQTSASDDDAEPKDTQPDEKTWVKVPPVPEDE